MGADGAPGAPPTSNRIRMSAEKACFFGGLCATGRQKRSSGFPSLLAGRSSKTVPRRRVSELAGLAGRVHGSWGPSARCGDGSMAKLLKSWALSPRAETLTVFSPCTPRAAKERSGRGERPANRGGSAWQSRIILNYVNPSQRCTGLRRSNVENAWPGGGHPPRSITADEVAITNVVRWGA